MRTLLILTIFTLLSCNGGSGGGGQAAAAPITFPTSGYYAYSDGVSLAIHLTLDGDTFEAVYYDIANDEHFTEYGLITAQADTVVFSLTSTAPVSCTATGDYLYEYVVGPTTLNLSPTFSNLIIQAVEIADDAATYIPGSSTASCW